MSTTVFQLKLASKLYSIKNHYQPSADQYHSIAFEQIWNWKRKKILPKSVASGDSTWKIKISRMLSYKWSTPTLQIINFFHSNEIIFYFHGCSFFVHMFAWACIEVRANLRRYEHWTPSSTHTSEKKNFAQLNKTLHYFTVKTNNLWYTSTT